MNNQHSGNWSQRFIQKFLGTREVAVLFMFGMCITVEVGILAATQQYERSQAVPGTVLWMGMSAAGLLAFFAELLKLPVAWVTGVVSGKKRWLLHLVMIGICALTLLTVKDLTVREWTLSLAPSRERAAEAAKLEGKILALEAERTDLQEGRGVRLADLLRQQALLDATSKRVSEELAQAYERFQEEERSAAAEVLGEAAGRSLDVIKRQREEAKQSFDRQRTDLREQLAALERRLTETLNATTQPDAVVQAYKQEYERHRERIRRIRSDFEAALASADGFFQGSERERLRRELDVKLKEENELFEKFPKPVEFAGDGLNDIESEQESARTRLASLEETARNELRNLDQKEQDILAQADASSQGKVRLEQVRARWTQVKEEFGKRQQQNAESLDKVNADIAKLNGLDSGSVELRVMEITKALPELKQQSKELQVEAEQMGRDTIPMRTVDGLVKFLMPKASDEEQLRAAFAIFPFVFAFLVAFVPAIIIEIGAYSLRPEVVAHDRARLGWVARLSRGRKALRLLRQRAAECIREAEVRCQAAEGRVREIELRDQARAAEHAQAVAEFDKRVLGQIEAATSELKARLAQLDSECAAHSDEKRKLRADIAILDSATSAHIEDKRKLREDLDQLITRVTVMEVGAQSRSPLR